MRNEATLMRGDDWQGETVAGMYASRKLNGVAMLWDGSEGWTRSGKLIALPAYIHTTLPAFPVDCEVVSGQGGNADFNAASLAVRLNRWTPDIHAVCFDAPTMPGDWMQRLDAARAAGVACVATSVIKDETDLLWFFDRITRAGGEGLMLRRPGVGYRPGRSRDSLFKVKDVFHLGAFMDFLPCAVSAQN